MKRTRWFAPDLRIADEPLTVSLLKYRLKRDRWPSVYGNLVSSVLPNGRQAPIIDLDIPHVVVESTTAGHSHLYLDVEMSYVRWAVLMLALRFAGLVETGYVVWSLRRGANFVRVPGLAKSEDEIPKPRYGWFFKLRPR